MAAVTGAALAPYDAEGLDRYAGMAACAVASLRAAAAGRAAKEAYENSCEEFDPEFTATDDAALAGPWSWLGSVVGPAMAAGPAALVDDDLAYVNPWGFDPAQVTVPVLLLHGDCDRVVPASHDEWLAGHVPSAVLRLSTGEGHISVLDPAEPALEWVASLSR